MSVLPANRRFRGKTSRQNTEDRGISGPVGAGEMKLVLTFFNSMTWYLTRWRSESTWAIITENMSMVFLLLRALNCFNVYKLTNSDILRYYNFTQGESAKGKYPVECIRTMAAICREAESVISESQLHKDLRNRITYPATVTLSCAFAAVEASLRIDAKAIICITSSGE